MRSRPIPVPGAFYFWIFINQTYTLVIRIQSFFYIRIYLVSFIREYRGCNLRNFKMMFLLNCIKLFLSSNGKTGQQTEHSSLAMAKCSMSSMMSRKNKILIKNEIIYCFYFPAQAEFAYFSADFRLKIVLWMLYS